MSRGLGTIQRQLLIALFCAGRVEGEWVNLAESRGSAPGGDWYAVARLRLVEIEHDVEIGHTIHQKSGSDDRAFKRSRRAPVRRALRTLTDRGLAEERLIAVDLAELGQWNWRPQGGEPAIRPVLYARITELGEQWVIEHASDQIDQFTELMIKASFNHDPEARERRMARKAQREWRIEQALKSRKSLSRRTTAAAGDGKGQIVFPTEALSKDELVRLLIDEGFDRERVPIVLRQWHRELQSNLRRQLGESGPPLDDYTFGSTEIEELRTLLSS